MRNCLHWFGRFPLWLLLGAALDTSGAKAQARTPATLPSAPATPAPRQAVQPTEIPLHVVAAQVASTLDLFNAEAASKALPRLSRVTFDFNTTGSRDTGFSLDLLLFKFGADRGTNTTNEVTFTYAVPVPGVASQHARPAAPNFSETLLGTLRAAAAEVKQTEHVGTASFSNLTVTLSYGVVWDTSAGGTGAVSLVTVDGSVDRKRADVQTLTLTFGQ